MPCSCSCSGADVKEDPVLLKSLCPVPEAVAAFGLIWVVSVFRGGSSRPGMRCCHSSGVPVLLFKPCQSHCSVVWLPLEAISGTAVAGLVSAMCSTGLKHIPGLCPCWGPAQPSLQAPLLVSPFPFSAFAHLWQHFHFCPHLVSSVIFLS